MTDQPFGSLAAALAQLQGQLPRVGKDATANTGAYSYKYATLANIHEVLLPLMAALGLAWICKPTLREDGRFVLAYTLLHAPSGEREDGDYPLPDSGGPQQLGSAITYGRRYLITAVTGIVAEDDDDGRAAQDDHDAALQQWNAPARTPAKPTGTPAAKTTTSGPANSSQSPTTGPAPVMQSSMRPSASSCANSAPKIRPTGTPWPCRYSTATGRSPP